MLMFRLLFLLDCEYSFFEFGQNEEGGRDVCVYICAHIPIPPPSSPPILHSYITRINNPYTSTYLPIPSHHLTSRTPPFPFRAPQSSPKSKIRHSITNFPFSLTHRSGFFTLFTTILFISQTHLVLLNMTTVEHLSLRSQKEREGAVLGRMFNPLACSARRRTRKMWDVEWGRLGKEGNIWWLGSKKRNWESVFGDRVGWWICEC